VLRVVPHLVVSHKLKARVGKYVRDFGPRVAAYVSDPVGLEVSPDSLVQVEEEEAAGVGLRGEMAERVAERREEVLEGE